VIKVNDLVACNSLQTYDELELKELVAFHSDVQHGDLTHDEVTIIRGALDLQEKEAGSMMTAVSRADIEVVMR
jgi:CBS domain containing-hemolysin-like protein